MSIVAPGEAVLELVRGATSRIVIAAPYIKLPSIRHALSQVSATVTECICVTRWLPEDIAAGACDLEIFDELADAPGGRLLVHPHLHAKYYADGVRALVGSANLTARGLGWYTPSNIELLVSLPQEFPGLLDWESMLLRSAVPATEELREQIRTRVDELKRAYPIQNVPEIGDESEEETDTGLWFPRCPAPERLLNAAIEACDRCISALTACVVLAPACKTCAIGSSVLRDQYKSFHYMMGSNKDMSRTKGGSTQNCIWPWMRMVCRSGLLLQKVQRQIVLKPAS